MKNVVDQLAQFDVEFEKNRKKSQLSSQPFGTPTHTSLYKTINEALERSNVSQKRFNNKDVSFIDFGSGTGNVLFLVRDRYEQLGKYIGIEYETSFHNEALRRQREFQFTNMDFQHRDILTIGQEFLNQMDSKIIFILSFDFVMPENVQKHIEMLVRAVDEAKHIIWVTCQDVTGTPNLSSRLIIGPPGLTENSENVYVTLTGMRDGDEPDVPWSELKKHMGKEQMEGIAVRLYSSKGYAQVGCLVCSQRAVHMCVCCRIPYCTQRCANVHHNVKYY